MRLPLSRYSLQLVILFTTSTILVAQNPVPFISQPLVPTSTSPGGQGFTLVVKGSGFVPTSVVRWDGAERSTTFLSATKLSAKIMSSDIVNKGTARIEVFTPAPEGGVSNIAFFEVRTPASTSVFSESDFTTGANPVGGAFGDFNGDGNLDLAVVNLTSNTVSILLGNGDGTFKPRTDLPTGTGPRSVAVGDFNGDGVPDLAITNSS